MRIIARKRPRDFAAVHADAAGALDDWYSIVKARQYRNAAQVKRDFPSVSFISNDVTVFNVGGNKYRLSVSIRYPHGTVYIRRVMTHAEYDRRSADGTL